jgi:transposase InsO family protein
MRDNSFDRTIERNYLQKWRFLIAEYEAIREGRSTQFASVGEFYRHNGTCSQTFRKYYNRYLHSGSEDDLLPQRRGPRWKTRRTPAPMEALIVEERKAGNNRYEICSALREKQHNPPSPSTVYQVLKRHGLNRISKPMIEEKRRIIKDKVGELGHVDLHQLPHDVFIEPPKEAAYVVLVIDSCSRLAWAEAVIGKKALPVTFKVMKILSTLERRYGVAFQEMLSDNGAEFSARKNPDNHPFEIMLKELQIRHRYTRPYTPKTNGKAERFWRTLDDDLIEGTTFDDLDHFRREMLEYMLYYNEFRPHQAIEGMTPKAFALTKAQP